MIDPELRETWFIKAETTSDCEHLFGQWDSLAPQYRHAIIQLDSTTESEASAIADALRDWHAFQPDGIPVFPLIAFFAIAARCLLPHQRIVAFAECASASKKWPELCQVATDMAKSASVLLGLPKPLPPPPPRIERPPPNQGEIRRLPDACFRLLNALDAVGLDCEQSCPVMVSELCRQGFWTTEAENLLVHHELAHADENAGDTYPTLTHYGAVVLAEYRLRMNEKKAPIGECEAAANLE